MEAVAPHRTELSVRPYPPRLRTDPVIKPQVARDAIRISRRVSQAISAELGHRVRDLSVRSDDGAGVATIRVTGTTASYHLKQIASRAAMNAIGPRPMLRLQNDLCVV